VQLTTVNAIHPANGVQHVILGKHRPLSLYLLCTPMPTTMPVNDTQDCKQAMSHTKWAQTMIDTILAIGKSFVCFFLVSFN
jgi:hypothetical protein